MQLTLSRQTAATSSTSSPIPTARRAARSATSTRRSIPTTRPAPMASQRKTARTCSMSRGTRSCPMAPRVRWTMPFGRGLLNGWQLSGISSMASGIPFRLSFSGAAAVDWIVGCLLRHRRRCRAALTAAATVSRRSIRATRRLSGSDVGEKLLDIGCISVPAFGRTAISCRRTTCDSRPASTTT